MPLTLRGMRYIVILLLMAGLFISVVPTAAQSTVFEQGYYEFESTIASMVYNGSWSTVNSGGVFSRQTSAGVSNVSFGVEGKTLIIWRLVRQSTGNNALICINGTSCVTMNCDSTTSFYWYPYTLTLPSGQNVITVSWSSGSINLDSFMVLSDPDLAAGMPTAVPTVPTATIIPSSTPAFTATPQPTSTPGNTPVPTATIIPSSTPAFTTTPQPTATPYELPNSFFAIDPAARYDMVNGQITVTRYETRASDYLTQFFLVALLVVNLIAVGMALWKRK